MKAFMILMAIIPMTGLLTVSFFVLFASSKAEHQGLKSFAGVIAVLLWLSAAMVLIGGIGMGMKGHMMGPGMMMNKMMMMQNWDKDKIDMMKKMMTEEKSTVPAKK